MIWPAKLAVFYPYTGRLPLWETAGAAALILAFTICAFLFRKRHPYLITGWCWYLVMLLPVIGLIQVSSQSHADRYTYLPQIGLYWMATWGIAELAASWQYRRQILSAAVIAFAWAARAQASYWHDSEKIWKRTLEVTTPGNDIVHLFLGKFLLQQHRFDDAIPEFRTFLTRNPKDADARADLACALAGKGNMSEAMAEYDHALKLDPTNSKAETTLANSLLEQGRLAEAIEQYRNVLRQHPSSALAHYNLAVGLHREGYLAEAIVQYKEALAIEPGYPDAESFLGQALLQNGQPDEAELHLKKR
jgi:tetratricopeptide (TPR) repeat protein